MQIDDRNRTPLTQSAEKADTAGQKRALERDSAAARGTDQADVSQLAQALATRDPKRIEQLKLEVESGKYDVSAEAVAKAIIDSHLHE
jgi:anti-sigma28 factor (negative regulator of flagellin synthesis)